MKKSLLIALMYAAFSNAFGQGQTTSSMNGKIVDSNGEPLIGATIVATHTPTGATWANVANINGSYRLNNLNVGGPYSVEVSYVGFESEKRENIYLSLGQTLNLKITLSESTTTLSEVVVTSNQGAIIDGNRTGAATFVGLESINALPTVSRSVGDFVRMTPQATVSEGNDGLEISIGGQNNRYNAIYIDGAVNNDVFGLAGSGTNGGQTGVSPISVDAIEQFTVNVAPFDVRQSGFAGGSISAVTRSGTNELEGSVYSFTRNENMAGKTPLEQGQQNNTREKLAPFTSRTSGFRVGGPIIKNKLFFFINGELQRDETPQPFSLENYQGNATAADLEGLKSFIQSTYNYDIGSYDNNTAFLNSDKFLAKIDFNLNQNHKITLRHSYTSAENLEARSSSSTGINFINGSEYFVSKTNSTALEVKSNLSNSLSNSLTIGSTFVRDDRDPFGDPFPAVFIDDGRGGITFGAETFSTANLLDQDIITINNNLEIYAGKHTLTAGFNLEFYRTKNLFIPFNYGDYDYDRSTPVNGVSDLNDFLTGANPSFFIRSYSLQDNVVGDESIAGVEFGGSQYSVYLQDEFQATDNLRITLGLRGDLSIFDDTPVNESFNNTTIPLLSQEYDLKGAETGKFIDPQVYLSPRLGFNYDINGDQSTQIRGGLGVFTSRIPLVWPGGAYNNNGVNRGTYLSFGSDPFVADINSQQPGVQDVNNPSPSGDIDLFVDDFRIPQVWKANLALDKKLPGGLIATLEGLYTGTINQVSYQNINLKKSVSNLEGTPDDRPIFDRRDEIDDTYGRIMLGDNTNKGYSYNLTASITKPFDNGLNWMFSYSYGDAFAVYDGTSSQNSSQWRGIYTVDGRNGFDELQRSSFSQGHRVLANVSYRKEYAKFFGTQISLIYEGRSGAPYSYIYGSGANIQNEDSRNRALVYIPASQDEIVLVENAYTVDQQWAFLDAFIENDPYLRENRGQYAKANENRAPFQNILDVRLLQDLYITTANGKRNTLQFSIDIFNFSNLLNKNWGKRYGRPFSYELLEFEGFQDNTNVPTYSFTPFNLDDPNRATYGDFRDSGILSSRWQMQLGLRYIFN